MLHMIQSIVHSQRTSQLVTCFPPSNRLSSSPFTTMLPTVAKKRTLFLAGRDFGLFQGLILPSWFNRYSVKEKAESDHISGERQLGVGRITDGKKENPAFRFHVRVRIVSFFLPRRAWISRMNAAWEKKGKEKW